MVIYNAVISAFEPLGRSWAVFRIGALALVNSRGSSELRKGGRWQEAVALLSQLERSKMETTVVSYGAAISACDKQTRWQQAIASVRGTWECLAWLNHYFLRASPHGGWVFETHEMYQCQPQV